MDDSIELIDLFSGVATSRDSSGYAMYLPRGCLVIETISHWVIYDHSPYAELRFSTLHK